MESIESNQIAALESDYLYVATSQIPNAGMGLYTAIPIYKEEIIAYYHGEILSPSEVKERESRGEDQYFMVLLDGKVLDCRSVIGFAKYANDAAAIGKSDFKNNAKITLDDNGKVCLVAIKKIHAAQEIFCAYGKKYWKKHIER